MDIQRAQQKVITTGTGCWEWQGDVSRDGYGRLRVGRKCVFAHRFFYTALRGDPGRCLDHLCRNRKCVNPEHLEPVTLKENVLRGEGMGARYARRTHCSFGHEYSSANTRYTTSGRKCRACDARRQREYKARANATGGSA